MRTLLRRIAVDFFSFVFSVIGEARRRQRDTRLDALFADLESRHQRNAEHYDAVRADIERGARTGPRRARRPV